MAVKDKKNFMFYLIFCLIVFGAILLRITTVDFDRPINAGDETAYENSAENLLKYGMFTSDRNGEIRSGIKDPEPASVLQIGYPVVISVIYSLFGHASKNVFYFQFLLSILDILLIYAIMSSCNCKRKWMLLVLSLVACYPGFIYNINRMLTESLFKSLLLLFVFFICRALNAENKLKWYVSGAITCGAAVFVRGLALPFSFLIIFIILLYEKRYKIKLILSFGGTFILTQLWWWIRNALVFHRFILLSDAGESPKIWGLMPYYIDMASAEGYTANQLFEADKGINFFVFLRWKLFGQTNYLWQDIWDEQLVHPQFRWALWIQILIIFSGIFLPIIIKKCDAKILLLTSFPIGFTIFYLPYHGLPRYLYPAIPFLFISLAILLSGNMNKKNEQVENRKITLVRLRCEKIYFFLSILFSSILFISIFIFSPFMEKEMSEWRLNKYARTSISEVDKSECIWQKDYKVDEVTIENSIEKNAREGKYTNDKENTSIIKVKGEALNTSKRIVTKVEIDMSGGYFWYDYFTIYWQNSKEEYNNYFDQNHYYKIPTNILKKHFTIYIDGDVTTLTIIPGDFRGGKFNYKNVRISKMVIDNL